MPSAQYLNKYVFFTDPTYSETNLVVIRSKKDGAFADVTLGCAGVLGGWQPIGADQEFTRIDLVTGNFMDVGGCSNGRHEINSTNPFGVTVWGSAVVQSTFAYLVTWFFLLGAPRAVLEMQSGRRRVRRRGGSDVSDAGMLGRLTHLPGLFWVGVLLLVCLGCLALGGAWLVDLQLA